MKAYKPTDATTNPSLILSAAGMDQYQHIIDKAIKHGVKTAEYVCPIRGIRFQRRTLLINPILFTDQRMTASPKRWTCCACCSAARS